MIKLTGTQYIMTSTSGFPLWKMALRNIFFLYFLWRIIFLSGKRITPILAYILQTLFMTILLLVYEYSGEIILLSQLFTLKEGLTAIGSLSTVVFKPSNLILIFDIPVLFLILYQYHRIRKSLIPLFLPMAVLTGIGLYLLLVKLDYFKGTGTEWGILGRQAKYGTIYTSLVLSDTSNQKDAVNSIVYGTEITIPEKSIKHNVITIQVESLTADILFQEYKDSPVMPFLSSLAMENIYYPYLTAQHKTGASSDAEFSAINGVEAIRGFPACQFTIYDYPNSFIKRFPDKVNTLVFHANTGSYFNRNFNLPAMGFDNFYDLFEMGLNEKKWGGSDGDLFSFVTKTLKEEKNPYYYHIITMTSHGPFNLVYSVYSEDRFDDIPVKEEKDYFTSMSYVDTVLAKGIREIREIDPEAYIFIYGDHSIKLKGRYYENKSYLFIDSRKFEFVPLIIVSPNSVSYKETEKVVSILDIGVSVLDASGYGGTIKSFGSSLLEPELINSAFPNDGKLYDRNKIFSLIENNK
ncbi:MAG: LTA synthase family protein [Spirochaetales bacterium]|nr:LTA synthase family protein [Spirochaetales bacterium]